MKKPTNIINTPPGDNESWGSYDSETKQWSERVYSGKAIREWIQTNISNLKRASSTLNTLLSKLFGDNFINLINSYTKPPITDRLDTAERIIGQSTDSELKTGSLFARIKYAQNKIDGLTFETEDITPDPNKYYITEQKQLVVKEGENEKYSLNVEVPVAKDYKILNYVLQTSTTIPTNWKQLKTTQTANTITVTLKDIVVSGWYNNSNQYIVLEQNPNKTELAQYINVTDSLGGSLTDQFGLTIINNLAYIKWNGITPLDDSDQGIKIIFKL